MRSRGGIPHFEAFLPSFLDLVVWGHEVSDAEMG